MQSTTEETGQAILKSYCDVCFVPFNKIVPRKLDEEGLEVLYCIKCKCRTHRCCYDMEAPSTFITSQLRQFVCQRCSSSEVSSKACIICQRKDGTMKKVSPNQVIHVFCALTHNGIQTVQFYPELIFRKSFDYKETKDNCGICLKKNATENCAMESCRKKFHGYCVWVNLKNKENEQDEPQCEKFYLQSGDCGQFDLSRQIIPSNWAFQEFQKSLVKMESYGFAIAKKDKIKEEVYGSYLEEEKERMESDKTVLRRGGFAYVLCKDHERSIYCNCMDRGTGDMVQCDCCFEWYHQRCVNYDPHSESEQYICQYCVSFYDLKRKMIEEVKGSKTEHYQLKFDQPKLHLMDFIWLLRVIDHRISGGLATKMIKQLAKYPLKTSKMDLIVKNQNRKKMAILVENFLQQYLKSPDHEKAIKPRPVLRLSTEKKPIVIEENVECNKKIKDYVEFLKNNLHDAHLKGKLKTILDELKFKEKILADDSYENTLQLSKSTLGYEEIPILKIKVQAFSFMQVIKEIDMGTEIEFGDLEDAVKKASSCENVPEYLLKPLIQRYEKVKNLVQIVSKNIHQKKETSSIIENTIKRLKEENILPPQSYRSLQQERKFIQELYLVFLKQQGKPFEENKQFTDKLNELHQNPACKPNRELYELISSFQLADVNIYPELLQIHEKYTKVAIIFEIKESCKKKIIRLSTLNDFGNKLKPYCDHQSFLEDEEIDKLIKNWYKIKELWAEGLKKYSLRIQTINDIQGISELLKIMEECHEKIQEFPLKIVNKQEEIADLGSIKGLQKKKNCLQILIVLFTESLLPKNPFTIHQLPQGMPLENPIIQNFLTLKKQYHELMGKYHSSYERIKKKLQALKDQKRPRKQLIKDNLEKPNMSQFIDFIEVMKNSSISFEKQIKEMTESINNSIEIASKVKKFLEEEKHLESLFNEKQIQEVKKEIAELRKKVLLESELCLDSEFKELYQAEICIRMQQMMISSHPDLDKMGKLLKFAQEEYLDHLSIYKKLKSIFEIGNESSKEVNMIKKHQQILATEASIENRDRNTDLAFINLVKLRKSLTLSLPKSLKQKNSRIEGLLEKNTYLKNKISMILLQEPKKYEIDEVKQTYLEALKNPFEVEGLNKLISEMIKADEILKSWKNCRENQIPGDEVFDKYRELSLSIDEVEAFYKDVQECEDMMKKIIILKQSECNQQGILKVEEINQEVDKKISSKNSESFYNMKYEYFSFWRKFLQKCQKKKEEKIPYNKIRSLTIQLYYLIQKSIKLQINHTKFREIIEIFEENLISIVKYFTNKGKSDKQEEKKEAVSSYIDIEELEFEVTDGLDIKEEIKPLDPYHDLNKFYFSDISQSLMRPNKIEEISSIKRIRNENYQSDHIFEDPYKNQTKMQRRKMNEKEEDSENSDSEENNQIKENLKKKQSKEFANNVTDRERFKIKEILLKNMKKNSEFSKYQDLSEQVRLIENQLFGEYHNNIVKYLEMSDLFEKMFIKLISFSNLSAKIVKKKFEWGFLKLLIENKDNFREMERILIERNKEVEQGNIKNMEPNKNEKKMTQSKNQENESQKRKKNVFQMIASGKIDEEERMEMKKEIKSIREKEKKKKKHHKRRSRSRERSPQAKFSSDSSDQNLPNYIEKEYGGQIGNDPQNTDPKQNSPYLFGENFHDGEKLKTNQSQDMPLMFNPDEENEGLEDANDKKSKQIQRGTILCLKKTDMELNFKKKGKISLKNISMLTNEDYQKIHKQLIDPNFQAPLVVRKEKNQREIIEYLSKSPSSSRKKYKFLVGWFQCAYQNNANEEEKQNRKKYNELIRDFTSQTVGRQKIYGIQNEHIKMHIMSIRQYMKILTPTILHSFCEPPQRVTCTENSQILRDDRLIFVIQYPSQKMYELKTVYQNFNIEQAQVEKSPNTDSQTNGYKVEIPDIVINTLGPGQFQTPNYQPISHYSTLVPQQAYGFNQPSSQPEIKTIEYEGWRMEDCQEEVQYYNTGIQNLNDLGRFSPILTDEELEEDKNEMGESRKNEKALFQNPKEKNNQEDDIGDFVSNILNSMGNNDFKHPEATLEREESRNQIQNFNNRPPPEADRRMYNTNQNMPRWPQQMNQQFGQNRVPYNPMAIGNQQLHRNVPQPPMTPNMIFNKNNPMMNQIGGNRTFYPPPPPPPQNSYGQGGYKKQ